MAASIKPPETAHCLIISANKVETPYPVFPIGVAHIIGSLQQQGHFVDHFDYLASGGIEGLQELITDNNYDIIGISIRNIDNVDSADPQKLLGGIVTIIQEIRAHCDATVILGGPGFSIMPEVLLDYLGGDYGIVGEGEVAFPRSFRRS